MNNIEEQSPRGVGEHKKVLLKISQNLKENTYFGSFIKKETPTQVYSSEFCEI